MGYSYYGTVSNTYAIGRVSGLTGGTFGGLVAINQASSVLNSYWDTQTTSQGSSAGGTGKTTAQMYLQETYVSWDFATIWSINNGTNYPKLQVFDLPEVR